MLDFDQPLEPAPVFIIGPPRSGTTLLLDLLSKHPDIAGHSDMFYRFHHDLGLWPRPESVRHFHLTSDDATPQLTRAYRRMLRHRLASTPGRILVLKISTLSIQIDYVRAMVPEGRFIQLVRDGRDAACSMEDLRQAREKQQGRPRLLGPMADPFGLWCAQRFSNPLVRAVSSWYYHVTRSAQDLDFAPRKSWARWRYEDLVEAPEPTLGQILNFLELPFEPSIHKALTAITDRPDPQQPLGFSTTFATGPTRRQRFTRDMSDDVRVAVAPLINAPMQRLGYSVDPEPSVEDWAAACARLQLPGEAWQNMVAQRRREEEIFARAFGPDGSEHLRPTHRLVLREGVCFSTTQRFLDGQQQMPFSTFRKQDRQLSFHDPLGLAGRLTEAFGTQQPLEALYQTLPPGHRHAALDILSRLQRLALVGTI